MSNQPTENKKQYKIKPLPIKQILQNLQLKLTQTNHSILIELLKDNQPIAPQIIEEISQFISNLSEKEENLSKKIKIALLLKKLSLPLNKNLFNLFKNSLNTKTNFKDLISKFVNINTLINSADALIANNESEKQIQQIINNLSIKTNDSNQKILKAMIKLDLPLTQDNFNQIKNNSYSNKEFEAHTLLEKLNLNHNDENLLKLISSMTFKESTNLAESIAKLITSIMDRRVKEAPQLILPKLHQTIAKNPKLIVQIKEYLPKEIFKEFSNTIKSPNFKQNVKSQENINKILTESIITPDNLKQEQIQKSITTLNQTNSKDLLKNLFHLSTSSTNEELSDSSYKLVKELLSQQLLNYDNQVISLFIPFLLSDKINLAKLIINRDANSEKDKQDNLNFSFAVSTAKLGDIEVKIKIINKKIHCLLTTNRSATFTLIDSHLNQLKNSLEEHHYQLNYLNCKLLEEEIINNKEYNLKLTNIDFSI